MRRILLLILISIFPIFLGGSNSFANGSPDYNPEFNLWPFVYFNKNEASGTKKLEVLYPFFEWRKDADKKEFYFRPFYNEREDTNKDTKDIELFWPLSFSTRSLTRTHKRSFPFFSSLSDTTKAADHEMEMAQETDKVLFPFYFGRATEHGRDFAIFPLFGSFYNRFKKDSVQFLMWPLYTRSTKDDLTKWNYFWPVFSYSRSSEDRGFKVWPFYGRTVESGKDAEKGFVGWPFYVYKNFDIDGVGRYRAWGSLPFYAREESPLSTQTSIIWPFFSHMENAYEGYERWNYFWPLGTYLKGDTRHSNTFLPLWSYHKIGGVRNLSIIWPIFWDMKDTSEGYVSRTKRIIPLYWSRHEEWPKEGKEASTRQVWPIYKSQKNKDGSSEFQLLSLYFMRAGEDSWNRNWGPLFSIFYHYDDPDEGVSTSRLFSRLIRYEKSPAVSYLGIAPFFSFQKDLEKQTSKYSFLLSMIRYEDINGLGTFKLFYVFNIPIPVGKRERAETAGLEETFIKKEMLWNSTHGHDLYWASSRAILKGQKGDQKGRPVKEGF